ncbi:MAG TPA: heme-binding protein [Usitatibacter sp.]|nr:heme-binding protein [Usitatibacter sp.]
MRLEIAAAVIGSGLAVAACSGSSGGASPGACTAACDAPKALTPADVQRVIAQAAAEAQARGAPAQIAVVDRVGNVLAVFTMPGAPATIAIASGFGRGGLDGIEAGTIPATLAAISKAITGAYLSSQGNAFSTRTAGQIVQEHFDPQEQNQPSGPLYGVQFSQLTCSDVNRSGVDATAGPKRAPLGLAADPGGLPLYKDGVLVGGIGIEADGRYGLDRDITDTDESPEERIAVAGASGLDAPADIRADRITADGHAFRYVDGEGLRTDPSRAPAFSATPGTITAVAGYSTAAVRGGTAFGSNASGVRADAGDFAAAGGWILVDEAGSNRFPVRGTASIGAAEVRSLLGEALAIAARARGQIRRPLGSSAHVSIAVVDTNGDILGLVRTSDAPVFGIDVAVQKARTAMFFSHPGAAAAWRALPDAHELVGPTDVRLAHYLDETRAFLGAPDEFSGITAWTPRAIGNLHRPFFPDGIAATAPGPLSTPIDRWSPFNVGLQLDLVYNQLIKGVLGDTSTGCTGIAALRDGIQVFPGGVPIYRGDTLVGGIGVSGDGVDQDDMVAYLGLANAGRALGASGIANAPREKRADRYAPQNARLRYVQCPQSPFNGSSEQNVCD